MHLYVLDEHGLSRPEPDVAVWARWFEGADSQVAETLTANVRISTVFLGIDYDFGLSDRPILWETMVFGESMPSGIQCRYASREEALTGHAVIVVGVEHALRMRYEAKKRP